MPLSERERRILEEIEKGLNKEDPSFAREVRRKAPRAADRRRVKLGAVLLATGLLVLFAFFVTSAILIGVTAFALMVAGVVLIAGSLLGSLAPRRPPGPGIRGRVEALRDSVQDNIKRRYKRH
jgi:Flp pilus assembly protein TadB